MRQHGLTEQEIAAARLQQMSEAESMYRERNQVYSTVRPVPLSFCTYHVPTPPPIKHHKINWCTPGVIYKSQMPVLLWIQHPHYPLLCIPPLFRPKAQYACIAAYIGVLFSHIFQPAKKIQTVQCFATSSRGHADRAEGLADRTRDMSEVWAYYIAFQGGGATNRLRYGFDE